MLQDTCCALARSRTRTCSKTHIQTETLSRSLLAHGTAHTPRISSGQCVGLVDEAIGGVVVARQAPVATQRGPAQASLANTTTLGT